MQRRIKERKTMDRCKLANEYHSRGFNCAQSVMAAFQDLTHLPEEQALAVSGGFGGGIGGTHEEICGALSGAVMVLSTLYPHVGENNPETKRRLYGIVRECRSRFNQRFAHTRCGELLAAEISTGENTPAARRLGITAHCPILIVTAVEIVEEMLHERGVNC
jgi:C_GCAxxG_C_C family probable redox protein